MTKTTFFIFISCLFFAPATFAQVDILNKSIERINSYKTFTYSQISKQRNPFSGDWISLNLNAEVSYDAAKPSMERYNIFDKRGYRLIYDGNVDVQLDLNEKTYRVKEKKNDEATAYTTPYGWARFIRKKLNAKPKHIYKLGDTLVTDALCYHIKFVMTDSADNHEIHDLYIDKNTYLPMYVRQYLQGTFGKGDGEGVPALMINEDFYDNYKIDQKNFKEIASFTIPADFKPETKVALLAPGQKAPDWSLLNMQDKEVNNRQFGGSVILMDFSFNACAACMMSVPMLNKLHEKYKSSNVQIVTVNTSDTKPSMAAFIKKNKITYPVLRNGSKVSKSFQVSAYPTFYLIDKKGHIAASFEGYSSELEEQIINEVEKLR